MIAGGRKQHTAESVFEKLVGDRNLAVMTAVAEAIDDSLVGHVVSLVDILGNDGARPLSACRSLVSSDCLTGSYGLMGYVRPKPRKNMLGRRQDCRSSPGRNGIQIKYRHHDVVPLRLNTRSKRSRPQSSRQSTPPPQEELQWLGHQEPIDVGKGCEVCPQVR